MTYVPSIGSVATNPNHSHDCSSVLYTCVYIFIYTCGSFHAFYTHIHTFYIGAVFCYIGCVRHYKMYLILIWAFVTSTTLIRWFLKLSVILSLDCWTANQWLV